MFSASVVWGILILLPGLFFHIRLFAKRDHSVQVNHTNNPVAYITSISIGAGLAHLTLGFMLLLSDVIAKHFGILFTLDANIYAYSASDLNGQKIVMLCLWLAFMCVIAFVLATLLNRNARISDFIIDVKYGPFSQFYKKTANDDTLWLAHVLTKTERRTARYSQHLAYIGRLEKLVTESGSIREIHLGDANPFFIKMTAKNFSTVALNSDKVSKRMGSELEYICISHTEILNVAFLSVTPTEDVLKEFKQVKSTREYP